MPEILEPSYVPGMLSSVMDTRSRFLEEKYVVQLKDCLIYSCPELVAALHYRESGCNFERTIANGTGLPNGVDFETDAINVLNDWKAGYNMGDQIISDDDLAEMLEIAEKYNGTGYRKHNIESPYVYSGTNLYTEGKFASDGEFDENLVDQQPGVYLLITSLQ